MHTMWRPILVLGLVGAAVLAAAWLFRPGPEGARDGARPAQQGAGSLLATPESASAPSAAAEERVSTVLAGDEGNRPGTSDADLPAADFEAAARPVRAGDYYGYPLAQLETLAAAGDGAAMVALGLRELERDEPARRQRGRDALEGALLWGVLEAPLALLVADTLREQAHAPEALDTARCWCALGEALGVTVAGCAALPASPASQAQAAACAAERLARLQSGRAQLGLPPLAR